jgi:hypothetical protein
LAKISVINFFQYAVYKANFIRTPKQLTMKTSIRYRYILFTSCIGFVNASAQNIINDTVYVNTNSQVTFKFSGKADGTFEDSGDKSYQVLKGTSDKNFFVRATQPGVHPKLLQVSDGNRRHEFVLMYRDEIPNLMVDWSDSKRLKNYVNEKKKNVSNRLVLAQELMNRGQCEEALPLFSRLVYDVEKNQRESVLAMQVRCADDVGAARKAKFKNAIEKADVYSAEKKFQLASIEYENAYAMEQDPEVLSKWKKNNKAWCKSAGDSAGGMAAQKNYAKAVVYFQIAQAADSLDFARFYKSGHQTALLKYNDQMHEKFEVRANHVFELEEWEEAKVAYDSALVFKDHKLCKERLTKTKQKLLAKAEERIKEREYYRFLSTAKILAGKASILAEYEEAIAQYKKAGVIFKTRKYPKDKIAELEKLQKSLVSKNNKGKSE